MSTDPKKAKMAANGSAAKKLDGETLQELQDCANRIRITSIEITTAAKSGFVSI